MAGVSSRVWLDVDLGCLQRNFRRIQDAVAPAAVTAVLKANAYGLGLVPVARALHAAGARAFAVAEPNEALALLPLGLPVRILGAILPEEIDRAVEAGIVLPVTDLDTARHISDAAVRLTQTATVHILVDTGMGRLGIPLDEADTVIPAVVRLPGLDAEGIYSHFPAAYRGGAAYTRRQLNDFLALIATLDRQGIRFAKRHMANSDAVNNVPESFRPPFNEVRTGINLHGAFDSEGQRVLELESVVTLKTRLVAVRRLAAGTCIGYGCTYRLPSAMRIGTISAGYADGLPMALSNRGHVMIRNRACHVLGRVSMDYTTVSLEQVPDAVRGDEAVCLGGEGPAAVSVEDWAQIKGTHAYDIICSFGTRVERRYREGAAVCGLRSD